MSMSPSAACEGGLQPLLLHRAGWMEYHPPSKSMPDFISFLLPLPEHPWSGDSVGWHLRY
ncbi:hypothetical protein BRAS3843_520216 [Bradyrhizobium sp. STM 3843]|nr:hypothetical protein BRAS3843_520216 [Bradyrhizobium sp. STM 3843]